MTFVLGFICGVLAVIVISGILVIAMGKVWGD